VRTIEKKRTTSKPPAPFITSTLPAGGVIALELWRAEDRCVPAQTLYEGGYITYMRTDSTNLSQEAVSMARSYVGKEFGAKYVPEKPNFYSSSNKSAQEAHEAIRPTDAAFTPKDAHAKLGTDESKLYQLIWNRFLACQMPPAEFRPDDRDDRRADQAGRCGLPRDGSQARLRRLHARRRRHQRRSAFAGIAEKSAVFPIEVKPTQHFTQPPPRFTEASLVKRWSSSASVAVDVRVDHPDRSRTASTSCRRSAASSRRCSAWS
jgi:DNA topoisomerase-1